MAFLEVGMDFKQDAHFWWPDGHPGNVLDPLSQPVPTSDESDLGFELGESEPLADFLPHSVPQVWACSTNAMRLLEIAVPVGLQRISEVDTTRGTYTLVKVLICLDLLDRTRSFPIGDRGGYFECVLLEGTEHLAGTTLFHLCPPNSLETYCTHEFREMYESSGLSGLQFFDLPNG